MNALQAMAAFDEAVRSIKELTAELIRLREEIESLKTAMEKKEEVTK